MSWKKHSWKEKTAGACTFRHTVRRPYLKICEQVAGAACKLLPTLKDEYQDSLYNFLTLAQKPELKQ